MRRTCRAPVLVGLLLTASACLAAGADSPHPLMTWVKRHPLDGASGKPSPRLGYETSYGYDPVSRLLIRWGGHNQGGGGEQNAETWTYDLDSDVWTHKEPNDAPPGVCCAQQNVFDEALGRYIRFAAFSGNHGWQSFREIRLKNSSVWTYDLATNTWRDMRPCPAPRIAGLRGAAWDPHHQVTVVHGGENTSYGTVVYDLYTNTWHEMKPPKPTPEANLSQPGFTYDAVNRLFVLFGSQFGKDERTYVYDLRKNRWRVLDVAEHPPAEQTSPILAADTRGGVVLCSLKGPDRGHQTWLLDVSKPSWTRLKLQKEPDPSGDRNRVLLYLADRNLFFLENNTPGGDRGSREQQIWTLRLAERPAPVPAPELQVITESTGATLAWHAPAGDARGEWTVYRGRGARPWEVTLEPIARGVKGGVYRDAGLRPATVYFYQVRRAGADGTETAVSRLARTQPLVPQAPLVSVSGPRCAHLEWDPLPAPDVTGYHVERADVAVYSVLQFRRTKERYREASDLAAAGVRSIGPFVRLTAGPLAQPRFTDTAIDLGAGQVEPAQPLLLDRPLSKDETVADGKPYRFRTYAYRLIAVNRLGVESGPSPLGFTWPSAVQHVFAKEEGQSATRIRWRANPEKGVKGYFVYRHDGRYDKDPIVRLTPEPIQTTEFLDEAAGQSTRRYEVVAVDCLGQEGEPSQPVWSRREWRRYYMPYVGEWHQ